MVLVLVGAFVLAGVIVGGLTLLVNTHSYPAPETETPLEYEQTTVTVVDADSGDQLGQVEATVADTWRKRYTGLSETESLPEDRGMLFTYDSEWSRTYVMRGMSFGIDIVYVAANGTITRIHHAPEPPEDADGEEFEYPGTGQYVLEVNYDWTTRHNVTEGDRVELGDV